MARRANQNLTPKEAAIKRQVAAVHELRISRGKYAGAGSALQFDLGIINGTIATLMLDADSRKAVIDWITNHIDQLEADNEILGMAFRAIQTALMAATERATATID